MVKWHIQLVHLEIVEMPWLHTDQIAEADTVQPTEGSLMEDRPC